MFTPHRKGWGSGWSPSPSTANARTSVDSSILKGKDVADGPPPPPVASFDENTANGYGVGVSDSDSRAWKQFRQAGLLDEGTLQRKEREALVQRVAEIESELHEYQYNMGLLLIEKKNWVTKYDEISKTLAETQELLQREQEAKFSIISELEKKEENARKALGVEKQCVADLETALREMRSEVAEMKFSSEKRLEEARSLEATLEEKYREIESKLHSANAKLAEANRKSSLADRKLEDIEGHERKIEKEKLSFNAEFNTQEKHLNEQRERLHEWEIKLQDGQNRITEGHRLLNERERSANEKDRLLKNKNEELQAALKTTEAMKSTIQRKEDDINTRLHVLNGREKDMEAKRASLEKKEKELVAREEKAAAREATELQKLLDSHNAILESKRSEFELEIRKKRETCDEELKARTDALDKKLKELNIKEDEISRLKQSLKDEDTKLEKKAADVQSKSIALRKKEELIKIDEKKLMEEKQRVDAERQQVENCKLELEMLRNTVEAEKEKIISHQEALTLTEKEREEHSILTSRMNEEIENYKIQVNCVLKEREDLVQQKHKFEREWEALDEKKVGLEADIKSLNDDKENFERWRESEEKRLNNMLLEIQLKCKNELEDVALQKEAFRNEIQHERSEIEESLKRDRDDNARNLLLRKHELEMEMEKRISDREKEYEKLENELRKKVEFGENKIQHAIESNESKIQKIQLERDQLRMEKEMLIADRQKLDNERMEIKKDIDTLSFLSKNLKDRREAYMKEKNHFFALAEQFRVCRSCGAPVMDNLDMVFQNAENSPMQNDVVEMHLKSQNAQGSHPDATSDPTSAGLGKSILRMCSKLFSYSPGKKAECSSGADSPIPLSARFDREGSDKEVSERTLDYVPTPMYKASSRSYDAPKTQVEDDKAVENEKSVRIDGGDNEETSFTVVDYHSEDTHSLHHNGRDESVFPDNCSLLELSKPRRRQPVHKGNKVKRTKSVLAVVEDAKVILGETLEGDTDFHEGHAGHVAHGGRKRLLSDVSETAPSISEGDQSEDASEGVSVGGRRRKKRQISSRVTQSPAAQRYNFRQRTRGKAAAAVKRNKKSEKEKEDTVKGEENAASAEEKTEQVFEESSSYIAVEDGNRDLMGNTVPGNAAKIRELSMRAIQAEAPFLVLKENNNEDEFINGTAEVSTPDSSGICPAQDDEEEDECDKQNLSVGKKLWTFFTT